VGAGRSFRSQASVAPAGAMSAMAEERPPDAARRWNAVTPWEGKRYGLPSTVVRDARCPGGLADTPAAV
jgi:hypothetical protein